MKNFKRSGDLITVPAPSACTGGQGVLIGAALFGVAVADAATGADLVLATSGEFDLAKDGSNIALGGLVYFVAGTRLATATASGNTLIGKATIAAGAGATTVSVLVR